jgi:hypothetical protein
MALMTAPQLAVTLFSRWNWPVRTLLAVAMFPVSGLAIAWAFGVIDGYWKP